MTQAAIIVCVGGVELKRQIADAISMPTYLRDLVTAHRPARSDINAKKQP
jgi:hypothetical protein